MVKIKYTRKLEFIAICDKLKFDFLCKICYMDELLIAAIDKAYKEKKSVADVTDMFLFDIGTWLEGAGTSITKQEEVEAILFRKLFNAVSETDDELRVTIKSSIIE